MPTMAKIRKKRPAEVTPVHRLFLPAIVIVTGAASFAAPHAIAQAGRDLVWTRPGLDSLPVERIAMLPVVSFTGDLQAEKLTENLLSSMLRESGYKWMTGSSTRILLRNAAPGDSLLNVVRDDVKESPPIDSLMAIALCGRFRTDAVLSVRLDRWEQLELEPIQSGKPSTTVHAHAALVDSMGRVLWTISGSETEEGPHYNPDTNPYQTPGGGVTTRSLANVPPPPPYRDVASRMFARWGQEFPKRVEAGE